MRGSGFVLGVLVSEGVRVCIGVLVSEEVRVCIGGILVSEGVGVFYSGYW